MEVPDQPLRTWGVLVHGGGGGGGGGGNGSGAG